MIKVFNIKVAFITALFGAFGLVLIKIFDIKNLPTFITGMGMLFSLILSFICSTLLLSRLSASKRNWLVVAATTLFVISVALFFQLQEKIDMQTIDLEEFSGDSTVTNRYFKGTAYTADAIKYRNINPAATDEEIIAASENKVHNVWTPQSIKSVIRETTFM